MARQVVVQAGERKRMIAEGLAGLAATRGLAVLEDQGLLDEVAGLVEWPVPLIGAIDPAYMDLPPEVMQVSMRVNQRYFALRDALGRAAPFFAFVANIEAGDGGRAIIAGNERVLRARFADARHFWDLDRHATLASRVAALEGITFHAKLGTQGARVKRLVALAGKLAPLVGADVALAERAALLAKADLTTGMVGEFPELQGVMGGYYATHDNEPAAVAAAVRDHYLPKGPGDGLPENPVGTAVALADKLDQIVSFFAVGEKPTGSGDPFALRRAALGIIRILREGTIRLGLREAAGWAAGEANAAAVPEVLDFLLDRLRVQLRADGARHDVLNAVLGAGADDDIVRLLARTAAVSEFLATEAGANLLAASRRAANILRIETKKDGREFDGAIDSTLLEEAAERDLALAIGQVGPDVATAIGDERFTDAMASLAALRGPVDQFFDMILVNAERPELRQNRLRLLFHLRAAMNMAADFSRIEG
jgi:glycyl-tRNA synthetase beta chain